jgi:hypothetical protein
MRHASVEDLEDLAGLLTELRAVEGLTERNPGVFYRRSRAFLHFHHDPAGMFADLRLGDDFVRFPVRTPQQQADLLKKVRAVGESGLP